MLMSVFTAARTSNGQICCSHPLVIFPKHKFKKPNF